MDVKTIFLNGNLEEEMYMAQSEGVVTTRKESLMCKLKKLTYILKKTSKKRYLEFNNTIM